MVNDDMRHSVGRTKAFLYAIWCCFAFRVVFYSSVFPMWEGYDEYSHFAMIQHIALRGDLPDARTANSSRQVAESLKLVPLPWLIHNKANGLLSHDEFWQLPPHERKKRQSELQRLPSEWAAQTAEPRLPLYEAQQTPLYYWLMSPVFLAVRRMDLPTQVWILRAVSALIASMVVPIAFLIGRRVLSNDRMALGVALVIASMPQLMITLSRVSNESLAIPVGSLVILLGIRFADSSPSVPQGALFGLALSAALLTKAYFLALIPFAVAVSLYVYYANPAEKRAAIRQALAAFATCVLLCGWWYGRTMLRTGSITGEQTEVAAHLSSRISLLNAIWSIHWFRVFDLLAVSHIWLGNWSFLVVRSWMYHLIDFLAALALLGVVWQTFSPGRFLIRARDVLLLSMPYATLFLGLCYQATAAFRAVGAAGTLGYYLYGLIVPEAVLLIVGLARLLPERWISLPVPVLVTIFVTLECFGTWCLLLPYYGGLIRHNAAGNLPAFPVLRLAHDGPGVLFTNLSINKPECVTANLILTGAILLICSGVGLIGAGCMLARVAGRSPVPSRRLST